MTSEGPHGEPVEWSQQPGAVPPPQPPQSYPAQPGYQQPPPPGYQQQPPYPPQPGYPQQQPQPGYQPQPPYPGQPGYQQQPPQQAAYPPPAYPPPPAYAQQPAHGYPPPGYGPGVGATPPSPYAHWGHRVGAALLDSLVASPGTILYVIGLGIGGGGGAALAVLGILIGIGIMIWNIGVKQGTTGQSVGKGVLKIKLVKEQTGQPVGTGLAIGRQFTHILDSFCFIGYLWPLWDAKRQTFADKILTTVVVPVS